VCVCMCVCFVCVYVCAHNNDMCVCLRERVDLSRANPFSFCSDCTQNVFCCRNFCRDFVGLIPGLRRHLPNV